jgi:hypothetical protein
VTRNAGWAASCGNLAGMRPIPLRPDPDSVRVLALRSLARAAIAVGRRALDGGATPSARSLPDFLRDRGWDDDRVAGIVTRTASNPAMLGDPQWAGELGGVATSFLASLVPMSAGAQLLGACFSLAFDGRAAIRLPALSGTAAQRAEWVADGAPIRVLQLAS